MKILFLSLIMTLANVCVANASILEKNDTTVVMECEEFVIKDSLYVNNDTLPMTVPVPSLEWNKNYTVRPRVKPDYMFVPLIYEQYVSTCDKKNVERSSDLQLNVNDKWLEKSMTKRDKTRKMRFNAMVDYPQITIYNEKNLPEPPKTYIITTDPSKQTVTIKERTFDKVEAIQGEKIKIRNWIHSFNASVQFSQAYLSDNWYQGGENNVNVIGQFIWNVKLNENVYKKLLFENSVQYKVSVNSAPQDSVRGYSISQDLFQVNTKFGYKAIRNWYYSTSMRFKTQLLNNYKANTNDMNAAFLSPAELNLGIGMTYNTTLKDKKLKFDMSLSPLSMDMNICREIKKIDPTSFGIDAGKHIKMEYGSNIEAKISWKLCHEITWSSRLFSFTNYDHIQGDWENTLDFTINKYLSTRLYAHLRYDSSVAKDPSWKYWQFNEILSFGFNYTFSM